jgi:hypothetical protein
VEDLSTLFEQMAQSFLKVLVPQKLTTNSASSSTNTQATTSLDPLSCTFCGQSGYFIAQCFICADYITNQRERLYFPMDSLPCTAFLVGLSKTVLMNGTSVIPLNPLPLMYKIDPVAASSQTSVATNMVSTLSTNVFTADRCIAALEQEIFNLRNAKRTFDGLKILKPAQANKPVPTEQPKAQGSAMKSTAPSSQPWQLLNNNSIINISIGN